MSDAINLAGEGHADENVSRKHLLQKEGKEARQVDAEVGAGADAPAPPPPPLRT